MDDNVLNIIGRAASGAGGGMIDPAGTQSLMADLINRLEMLQQAIGDIAHVTQVNATQADYSRLTIQMLMRILVENNVITEEEIKAKQEIEVKEVMERAQAEYMRQMEEQQKQQQAPPVEEEEEEEETEPGEPILASERAAAVTQEIVNDEVSEAVEQEEQKPEDSK